ncbi:hypothetical protein DKT69_14550 [Micromonospora sicca]|uniref:Cutinase n=2 Tax=Micromonospora sicca TaxID=2202420 RepID=A0A317DJJ2_9ACTN|nr:hypothetical protein DKT69_14550 [Micromonospora sp. 4G51]
MAALAVCVAASGAVAPIAAGHAQAAAQPTVCGEVFFLGARGSGQQQEGVADSSSPNFDSRTGFGPQVYQLYEKMKAGLGGRNLQSQALVYPAESVDVLKPTATQRTAIATALGKRGPARAAAIAAVIGDWRVSNLATYIGGLQIGVDAAYTTLTLRARSCPNERLVLAGYSQGAMVMHRLLNRLKDNAGRSILNRVDGVGLVADGDRVRNTEAVFLLGDPPSSHAGNGVASYFHLYNRDIPVEVGNLTVNICDRNDPVCDFRGLWTLQNSGHASEIHSGYTNGASLERAAKLLAAQVVRVPAPRVPAQVIGMVGQPLSLQLNANVVQGATLEWRVPSPYYLPDGLTMTTAGLIKGTPMSAFNGTTRVAVRAKYRGKFSAWIPADLTWAISAPSPVPNQPLMVTAFDTGIAGLGVFTPAATGKDGTLYFGASWDCPGWVCEDPWSSGDYGLLGVDPTTGQVTKKWRLPSGIKGATGQALAPVFDETGGAWIATTTGLARFSATGQVATLTLESDSEAIGAIGLAGLPDGTMWVWPYSTKLPQMLRLHSDGTTKPLTIPDGLSMYPSSYVDPAGTLWTTATPPVGGNRYLAAISLTGQVSTYPLPDWAISNCIAYPTPIVVGVVGSRVVLSGAQPRAIGCDDKPGAVFDIKDQTFIQTMSSPWTHSELGPDGRLWFANLNGCDSIGCGVARWDPQTKAIDATLGVDAYMRPGRASDGSMWVSEYSQSLMHDVLVRYSLPQ